MTEAKQFRRRWFRFSLRTLMLASVFLAVGVFWPVHKAQQQRIAVSAFEQLGCSIHYDDADHPLSALERLRSVLGEANFRDAIRISTHGSQLANAHVLDRKRATEPVVLVCTDAGLVHLARLPNLQTLELSDATITDVGLPYIEKLAHLEMLDLSGTKVSDEGLEALGRMNQLSALLLDRTQITDAGVTRLNGLTHLTWLGLGGTHVTDAGLVELQGMTQISILYLSGTRVTDAGLRHLEQLAQLECLFLQGTQVTELGIRRLKDALPNLVVAH